MIFKEQIYFLIGMIANTDRYKKVIGYCSREKVNIKGN